MSRALSDKQCSSDPRRDQPAQGQRRGTGAVLGRISQSLVEDWVLSNAVKSSTHNSTVKEARSDILRAIDGGDPAAGAVGSVGSF